MAAVVDRVLPQEDRTPERRIPILPGVDERLVANRIEGYRYEDMPSDQEAYRLAARAFETDGAGAARPAASMNCETLQQEELLQVDARRQSRGRRESSGRR